MFALTRVQTDSVMAKNERQSKISFLTDDCWLEIQHSNWAEKSSHLPSV